MNPLVEKVRRLAPHLVDSITMTGRPGVDWGFVPQTYGRVFVRYFSAWVCGPSRSEVRLDGAPVWRDFVEYKSTTGEYVPQGWLSPEDSQRLRRAERVASLARHVAREESRDILLSRLQAGQPVQYWTGQMGGAFALRYRDPDGAERVHTCSAAGAYRALEGRNPPPTWSDEFQDWAVRRAAGQLGGSWLPSRARRDEILFALAAEEDEPAPPAAPAAERF